MAFKGRFGIVERASSRGFLTYVAVGHCTNCGKDVRHDTSIDIDKWARAHEKMPSEEVIERNSFNLMNSRHICVKVGPNKSKIFISAGGHA